MLLEFANDSLTTINKRNINDHLKEKRNTRILVLINLILITE